MDVELEPQLVRLTSAGFVSDGIEEPGVCVFISAVIPRNVFCCTANYEFGEHKPFSTGRSLWLSGMQNRIVDEVMIFTDDLESGLFVAANAQNDPQYPFLFAKLTQCELHDRVMQAFVRFSRRFKYGRD